MTITLPWVIVFAVPVAALLAAVIARKGLRDVAERRRTATRDCLADAVRERDVERIAHTATGGLWPQADLLAVLASTADADVTALRSAVAVADDRPRLAAHLRRELRSRRPAKRGRALLLAGTLGIAELESDAAGLCADRHPDVRMAACTAMERFGDPPAVAHLVDALRTHAVGPSRIVERLAEPWAVEEMLAILSATDDGWVRAQLCRALGLAGDRSAVPALRHAAAAGSDEEVICAIRALGQLEATEAAPEVLGALASAVWEVRAQAARAAPIVAGAGAAGPLRAAMGDPAWWVRANAANALAHLGEDGIDALRDVYHGDDRYAAERAEEALWAIGAEV